MSYQEFCHAISDICQDDADNPVAIGGVLIDYTHFKKPETRDQKNKLMAHIANEFTLALLKSQENGLQVFNVHVTNMNLLKSKDVEISFCKELATLLSKMFENRLNKCYIMNPNKLFDNIYGVVESFIDGKTKKKIELVKNEQSSS